jgi:thiazolylpeptide-type bacteriocin precursor
LLIVFGLVTVFVSIPGGNVIYALLGLAIFGAYTVLDFNRMRRSGMAETVPLAAGSSSTSSTSSCSSCGCSAAGATDRSGSRASHVQSALRGALDRPQPPGPPPRAAGAGARRID